MRRQEPESVTKLQLSDRGSWIVTATSGEVFMLDLDAMMYYPLAPDEDHVFLDSGEPTLRRSGQPLPLRGIIGDEIRLGANVQLRLGGSPPIVRATESVNSILRTRPV